ncbi:MAG: endonuclease [Flavobacteriales bacterium]|nr:endonuclease [Flavobacteriales bacterium]
MQFIIRNIFMIACMVSISIASHAQAVLPTSWNFDVATPTGWTESLGGSNTRYANGLSGQACRLDATADYVLIQFAEEPGPLSYYLKGQNQGSAWQGTFTVEESVDGVSFTALHAFVNADLPYSAFTQYTDQPQAASRYIRFYFTNKVSGHNVALDDVNLAMPTAGQEQEINVTDASENVPSGFTYSIGNSATTSFVIHNLGLANDLNVSMIDISGPDAADFNIPASPSVIAAQSSAGFDLQFNPTGTGSRFCTLTILNDDASESEYVINIYGIAGTLATEPTVQASDISFSNVEAWDFTTTLTAGSSDAENFIVLRRKNAAVSDQPTDGSTYVKGEWIGSSQVVYVGDAASFDGRGIESGSTYHFAVFGFNGPEGYENYKTDNPLVDSQLAPAPSIGGFYSSVNSNSPDFVTQLTAVMNPANYYQVYYSNYISTLIDHFYVRDTAIAGVSMNSVECQYSGDHYNYAASFQWWSGSGAPSLSREHSYPQSWMPTYLDAGFDDSPEVSDLHNLFPVLQVQCNAVRSNYPYGEVVSVNSSYLDCKYGTNANNQLCYEMRDSFKGNAARGVMYQAVKNNTASDDFSFPEQIALAIPYGQNEYVVKQWHFDDLPDGFEITRNEYIQYEQHNRNAFIDSVLYPCYIRFANLTKFSPLVTFNQTAVTCVDPAISYQWYLEGELIEGATSASYNWTTPGNYTVAIQQFDECPIQSSQPVLVVDQISENENNLNFLVYPNPTQGEINLMVESNASGNARIEIIDATGKLVSATQQYLAQGSNKLALQQNLAKGNYIVKVNNGLQVSQQNLIVE